MNEVLIRQVTSRDLEACHAVESSCYPSTEAASKENIAKRIEQFSDGFFVAEVNGDIIGLINSGATNKEDITDEAFKAMSGHQTDGKNIVIFSVAVVPEFRGKGIARQLMAEFIARSKRLGKQKIMLICKMRLIDYYRQFGFVDVGPSASTHGGSRWHEMALLLDQNKPHT